MDLKRNNLLVILLFAAKVQIFIVLQFFYIYFFKIYPKKGNPGKTFSWDYKISKLFIY